MNAAVLSRRALLGWSAAALTTGLLSACGSTPGIPIPTGAAVTGNGSSGTTKANGLQELRGAGARLPAAPATATSNLNGFAAHLFRASAPGHANAVMSPYSVIAALGMAGLGADGVGLAAFTKVLGRPEDVAAQITAVDAAIAAALTASEKSISDRSGTKVDPMLVSAANSLFIDRTTKVLPAYLTDVAAGYDAGLFTVDFRHANEAAREQINQWASERTHELIPQILAPNIVTPDWRVALVNALYLKASWDEEFNRQDGELLFTTSAGKSVNADRLMAGDRTLATASGDGWTSVTLPYTGDRLAMTILLPDAGKFDTIASGLDAEALLAAMSGEQRLVNVTMPAFATDFPVDLTEPLKKLGLEPFFTTELSKLSVEPDPLFVSVVLHQAKIGVDEHGTEAAAATVVDAAPGAAPGPKEEPIRFVADRPFLYSIHDTITKVPLFLGRISDPTVE